MKRLQLILATTFGLIVLVPSPVMAQRVDPFKQVCDGRGRNSAACQDSQANQSQDNNAIFGPRGIITRIINVITIIVGIAAVVTIIMAGLKMITSGSNPQEVTRSREMILYAIVALVIAALAQAMVKFFLNRVIS